MTKTEVKYISIPDNLLKNCDNSYNGKLLTYSDAIIKLKSLKLDLDACNAMIKAAKDYQKEAEKSFKNQ